uniref:Uncharacterized protein 6 n=1 Tax=Haliotis asinina TaxID=109174 RepID=UP6_HALAI|nr:RecName: Full=Uncharacterized protein 6; Flags: Precursor [Haliotis asinina]
MGYFPYLAVFVCLLASGDAQWKGLRGSTKASWVRVVSPTLNVTQEAYIWDADSGISFISRSKLLTGTSINRNRAYTDYNQPKIAIKFRKDVGRTCILLDVASALIGTFNETSTNLQALTVLDTTEEKSYQSVGTVLSATSQSAFDLQHPFIQKKCSDRNYNYLATTELTAGAAPPPASDKFTVFTTWGKVHLYILQSTGLVITTTTEAP